MAEKAEKEAASNKKMNDEIAHFAAQKEKKMQQRAAREAEIAGEKARLRQRMIDRQVAHLQSLQTNEEKRLGDQVREAQEKRDREERAKQEARDRLQAACFQSHQRQLSEKAAIREQTLRDGELEKKEFKARYQQMVEADQMAESKRRQKALEVSKFQLHQAAEMMTRKAKTKADEDWEAEAIRRQLAEEDRFYQSYTEHLLNAATKEGRAALPLQMERSRHLKPGTLKQ